MFYPPYSQPRDALCELWERFTVQTRTGVVDLKMLKHHLTELKGGDTIIPLPTAVEA